MKLLCLIAFLGLLLQNGSNQGARSIALSDLLGSSLNIVEGIVQGISNVLPTSTDLFALPKQILLGLPESSVFQTISLTCALYMASNTTRPLETPDFDAMHFRLRTPCQETTFLLNNAEDILESPDFDVNKKLAIFIAGWFSSTEADYVIEMGNAFNCRPEYNFLAFNSSDSLQTLYTWASFNTEEVGHQLAKALVKLVKKVPAENIHLIGHSLGCHIAGYAGRYFSNYTGLNISRITGLDPAKPCFNEGESLSGLQRGDAEFIDIIHSNPGVLGKDTPIGDADFYPEGLSAIKPGCVLIPCSHFRSFKYFTESVYPGNEQNFQAVRCTSLLNLKNGFCNGPRFPMGFGVPFGLKGNYFLSVNGEEPYGQNSNGRPAVPSECENMCKNDFL